MLGRHTRQTVKHVANIAQLYVLFRIMKFHEYAQKTYKYTHLKKSVSVTLFLSFVNV
jgi:hypothetical protein